MTKIKINCNSNPHNNHDQHEQCLQIQYQSTLIDLCFVLFLVCLYVCVCECLLHNDTQMLRQIKFHTSRVHCGSAVRFCQAVPPYLITAHHLCSFLLYLAR